MENRPRYVTIQQISERASVSPNNPHELFAQVQLENGLWISVRVPDSRDPVAFWDFIICWARHENALDKHCQGASSLLEANIVLRKIAELDENGQEKPYNLDEERPTR